MNAIEEYGLRQYTRGWKKGFAEGKAQEKEEIIPKFAAYLKSESNGQLSNEQAMKKAREILADSSSES